jgi:hypothetical protein
VEKSLVTVILLTWYPALNSRDYNGLDMYKDSLLTVHKQALKAEFTSNGPVVRPRFKWDKTIKENAATTGCWPCRIE